MNTKIYNRIALTAVYMVVAVAADAGAVFAAKDVTVMRKAAIVPKAWGKTETMIGSVPREKDALEKKLDLLGRQ